MRKLIILALMLMILFAACQPAKKEEMPQPQAETSEAGEPAVGDFGNADSIDSDLNENELDGLDSGFSDIENI